MIVDFTIEQQYILISDT